MHSSFAWYAKTGEARRNLREASAAPSAAPISPGWNNATVFMIVNCSCIWLSSREGLLTCSTRRILGFADLVGNSDGDGCLLRDGDASVSFHSALCNYPYRCTDSKKRRRNIVPIGSASGRDRHTGHTQALSAGTGLLLKFARFTEDKPAVRRPLISFCAGRGLRVRACYCGIWPIARFKSASAKDRPQFASNKDAVALARSA